jgi:hypothetical protein
VNDIVRGRLLAALRFVDATTGATVPSSLAVSAPGTQFVRNRRGFYVITRSELLPGYDAAYPDAPATPAPQSVSLTVTAVDRSRRYLPRTVLVRLPRSASPALAEDPASLFQPLNVAMFPSPLATAEPGWAALRASVRRAGSDEGLPYTFLRVHRASDVNDVLGRGIADLRGEAFVPIAGIASVNWSSHPDHPVLVDSVSAVVQAFFDAAAGETPDPSVLEQNSSSLPNASVAVELAPGREVLARLDVALP